MSAVNRSKFASRGRPTFKGRFGASNRDAGGDSGSIPDALLKNARKSGMLNLSNRGLDDIPEKVWKLNLPPSEGAEFDGDDRWWDQVELRKLNLSSNRLSVISANIKNFNALISLDLHDNALESLPSALNELECLETLNVSHNKITDCNQALSGLNNLAVLLMQHNQLQGTVTLSFVPQLQKLDISNNQISSLEGVGNLTHLMQLNLSHNKLTQLSPDIGYAGKLTQLDLGNNSLTSIPETIGNLKGLNQLYLRYNKLTTIPSLISCVSLKELYLGNNLLKSIPQSIPSCVAILELRDNQVSNIDETILSVKCLQRLDISNNNIMNVIPEIANMPDLKVIILEGNPLRSIRRGLINQGSQAILKYLRSRIVSDVPDNDAQIGSSSLPQSSSNSDIIRTHNIKTSSKLDLSKSKDLAVLTSTLSDYSGASLVDLNLSLSGLKEVPAECSSFASTLDVLNLSRNKLSDLPNFLQDFKLLTHLDVSGNCMTNLPDLSSLTCLLEINLSSNQFNEIPSCVFNISSLENILADSNKIEVVNVEGLKKLKKLSILSLQYNSISNVPPELGLLDHIKSLQIDGNLFRVPRRAILQKGTVAILEYLRSRIPT